MHLHTNNKIFVHEGTTGGSDYSSTPSVTLGPNPASLSALKTPMYDTSDAVGMTMSYIGVFNAERLAGLGPKVTDGVEL
jgi:hypothetical protein